jgi:hypothetical protein
MKFEYSDERKEVLFIHEDSGNLFIPDDRSVFLGTWQEAVNYFQNLGYDYSVIAFYIVKNNLI